MNVTISNEIRIQGATPELLTWVRSNLILRNPEYDKKKRMGLWTGRTPEEIFLFRMDGYELILPCGTGKDLRRYIPADAEIQIDLADNGSLEYQGIVPLYDYQEKAVDALAAAGCGILQSPCGSGKTQMGIALAARLGRKTLWLTHTADLLQQSYDRAKEYFQESCLGTITAGKVHIGTHITFATVQTLSRLDLDAYKYVWDVVIVDECHRLAGSPTNITMFYKTLSRLAARYKYGLSATVHRSDGLIRSTFAIIGNVAYTVPEEAVEGKTMPVTVIRRDTGARIDKTCLDTDGTLIYAKLIQHLTEDPARCQIIANDMIRNSEHSNLILSDRVRHLQMLQLFLPADLQKCSALIDGKMTSAAARERRAKAIDDMRSGKLRYLFATYSLAKEGLDIPCLDRLYLTTPKKDFAVVTQSIGRIARTCDGKDAPVCYDYVDDIGFCENAWKKRRTSYRKAKCRIEGS